MRENSRRYGSRRVLEELKEQGVKPGRHRVRRLRQEQDWQAIQPRSFVPKTTDSRPGLMACANRLIKLGKPTAPNQAWVGDITYLPLSDGAWAYLASWMEWSDFYGSSKGWLIIFIIFFISADYSIDPMNELIADSV
ncbi:IS3 family transposase [Spirosoma aureum]